MYNKLSNYIVLSGSRTLIDFDDLMADAETELRRIARDLKLDFSIEEFDTFETSFLNNGLRHTVFRPTDLLDDESCPYLAYDIYHQLRLCHAEHDTCSSTLSDATFGWKKQLDIMKTALQVADAIENDKASLKTVLSERDAQIGQLVSETGSIVSEFENRLKKQETQIAELKDLLSRRQSKIEDLRSYISTLEDRLEGIINSRSWKMTAPIRKVKGSLANGPRTPSNHDR